MKFEIAPIDTHILCGSYEEAKMYLMFLEVNGKRKWRLPTRYEHCKYFVAGVNLNYNDHIWDQRDDNTILLNGNKRRVIPVRDL
jgi:hypothetical protein